MKRFLRVLVLAALGVTAGRIRAEDPSAFKVIVNASNPATQITRLKVGEIFLKKEKRWPDGQPAVPVEPPGKSAVRQRFDQEIFGKPVIAISAYWQQMIFGGKGVPPPEKSSDADVVAFVRETPGAVGYVWTGSEATGVKVVAVVD
jgi:ABC-type phosphate transport system substrate-binding protein